MFDASNFAIQQNQFLKENIHYHPENNNVLKGNEKLYGTKHPTKTHLTADPLKGYVIDIIRQKYFYQMSWFSFYYSFSIAYETSSCK